MKKIYFIGVRKIGFIILLLMALDAFAIDQMPDFKDPRDNRVYKTVQIGAQRWFAENLRFNMKGSWCYENRDDNCSRYGRLYDWAMAMKMVGYYNTHSIKKFDFSAVKGKYHDICPKGWHVPTNKDWFKLKYYVGRVGRSDGVGVSLKSTELWERELRVPAGSDEFGFNALPAGLKNPYSGFMDLGRNVQFWSTMEIDAGGAYYWSLMYDTRTFEKVMAGKDEGASVRCVEDRLYEIKEPPPPPVVVVPEVVKVKDKEILTIHIGDQVWMAKNLDVDAPGSFCYQRKDENCSKYGRFYTWTSAMKLSDGYATKSAQDSVKRVHRGVCPVGWHIPSIYDFDRLSAYLKDIDDAVSVGTNLKSRDVWLETENSMPGENGFGFNAFPYGVMLSDTVSGMDSLTGFWSTAEKDSATAFFWSLRYDSDDFSRDSLGKQIAFPVRCLMDPPGVDEIYDSTALYDSRDENRYKTVEIGGVRWMAENLRFAVPGSFCYENKDIRCRSYGRLYPWHVAMRLPEDFLVNPVEGGITVEHQGVCPAGWHMPSQKEWTDMMQAVAQMRKGSVAAALKMREGWVRGGAPISEASGFKAIPAGARYNDGEFAELGTSAYFWEASGGNDAGAGYWNLINSRDELSRAEDFDGAAFSVRCVKNALPDVKMVKKPEASAANAASAPAQEAPASGASAPETNTSAPAQEAPASGTPAAAPAGNAAP